MDQQAEILKVDGLTLLFGGLAALRDVSCDVRRRDITAIIGPNGAGKTSLLNSISGLYRPQQGQIIYIDDAGQKYNLLKHKPAQIARLGIARSFQNIELFKGMTVLDNLMLGRHIHMQYSLLASFLYWGPVQQKEIEHRRVVEQIIDLLEITAVRKHVVASLAYGLQKRVELGRALALSPRLLILDEPMAGMNSEEKEDMARFILDIHEELETSIILIEHDMGVVMDISDRVAVLDFGQMIAQGTPDEVRANPEVIRAYLGQAEGSRVQN
jgi:branched-chain amino acid transport system ATP-binding protein